MAEPQPPLHDASNGSCECEPRHIRIANYAGELRQGANPHAQGGRCHVAEPAHTLSLFVLLATAGISHAAQVGWPEAVSRLAAERYKAQTCVALLKGTKNEAQMARGRLAWPMPPPNPTMTPSLRAC